MPFKYMENDDKCLLIGKEMAIWEKPASGDKFGPYKHPEQHLEAVYFHSKFDYYAVAGSANVAITHAAHAAAPEFVYKSGNSIVDALIFSYSAHFNVYIVNHVLLQHNLGYPPKYLLADEDYNELAPGVPIQISANEDGGYRFVRHYATTTQIILQEVIQPGGVSIGAVSKTYRVVAFREPEADPEKPLYQATLNNVIAGQGKVDAAEKHLRTAASGETSFRLPLGPMCDIANGQIRWVQPDGTYLETERPYRPDLDLYDYYDGSFTGSDSLRVVA